MQTRRAALEPRMGRQRRAGAAWRRAVQSRPVGRRVPTSISPYLHPVLSILCPRVTRVKLGAGPFACGPKRSTGKLQCACRPLMLLVARKNLLTERTRLAISVGGVALSVFLIGILLSLYRGWNEKVGEYV